MSEVCYFNTNISDMRLIFISVLMRLNSKYNHYQTLD